MAPRSRPRAEGNAPAAPPLEPQSIASGNHPAPPPARSTLPEPALSLTRGYREPRRAREPVWLGHGVGQARQARQAAKAVAGARHQVLGLRESTPRQQAANQGQSTLRAALGCLGPTEAKSQPYFAAPPTTTLSSLRAVGRAEMYRGIDLMARGAPGPRRPRHEVVAHAFRHGNSSTTAARGQR